MEFRKLARDWVGVDPNKKRSVNKVLHQRPDLYHCKNRVDSQVVISVALHTSIVSRRAHITYEYVLKQ